MASIPPVHKLLFFISFLFGLDASVVGTEVSLEIDRQKKKARITYGNLLMDEEKEKMAEEILNGLAGGRGSDKRFSEMTIEGRKLKKEDGHLDLELLISYTDEAQFLERFGIQEEQDSLLFSAFPRESIESSNGTSKQEEIRWSKEVRTLKLQLSGEPLEKKEKASSVNLADHLDE